MDSADANDPIQKLLDDRRLASIGSVASGIAHELNNPVFAILGLSGLLLAEEHAPKTLERIELINRTALEIRELVATVLDAARSGAEPEQVVELAGVAATAAEVFNGVGSGTAVRIEAPEPERTSVRGRPGQLLHLVLALLVDAAQAAPRADELVMRVERDGADVTVSAGDRGVLRLPAA